MVFALGALAKTGRSKNRRLSGSPFFQPNAVHAVWRSATWLYSARQWHEGLAELSQHIVVPALQPQTPP